MVYLQRFRAINDHDLADDLLGLAFAKHSRRRASEFNVPPDEPTASRRMLRVLCCFEAMASGGFDAPARAASPAARTRMAEPVADLNEADGGVGALKTPAVQQAQAKRLMDNSAGHGWASRETDGLPTLGTQGLAQHFKMFQRHKDSARAA